MFRFFGGVRRLLVPDNLKSGVHKASFYDPEINRSYGATDALTDLSYKIHLNLDQLNEIWAQVGR